MHFFILLISAEKAVRFVTAWSKSEDNGLYQADSLEPYVPISAKAVVAPTFGGHG